ncbi:hypothetical protein ACWC1D_11955 [Streptomyces sp. NPDC001478]
MAKPAGADVLFSVAKRPHARRAVIDARLLLALLATEVELVM